MQMLKHRAKGSDVLAVQATAENMVELQAETGGALFNSAREEGVQYLIIETDDGSRRINAGDYLVKHTDGEAPEDTWYEVFAADDFDLRYERP